MQTTKYVLFAARHAHAEIDGLPSVFPACDALDFTRLNAVAMEFMAARAAEGTQRVHVYVTGLTPATIALYNAGVCFKLPITFWHYDRNSNTYVSQDTYIVGEE